MEKMQLAIGRLLLIGVILSFLIVLTGGVAYLWDNAGQSVDYEKFQGVQSSFTSISGIFKEALSLSPLAIIQAGILLLVLVQLLRVALIGMFFAKLKDGLFTAISGFIFLVLVYSLLSHF